MIPLSDWCAERRISERAVKNAARRNPTGCEVPIVWVSREQPFVLEPAEVQARAMDRLANSIDAAIAAFGAHQDPWAEVVSDRGVTERTDVGEASPGPAAQGDRVIDGRVTEVLQIVADAPFLDGLDPMPDEAVIGEALTAYDANRKSSLERRGLTADPEAGAAIGKALVWAASPAGETYWAVRCGSRRETAPDGVRYAAGQAWTAADLIAAEREMRDATACPAISGDVTRLVEAVSAIVAAKNPRAVLRHDGEARQRALMILHKETEVDVATLVDRFKTVFETHAYWSGRIKGFPNSSQWRSIMRDWVKDYGAAPATTTTAAQLIREYLSISGQTEQSIPRATMVKWHQSAVAAVESTSYTVEEMAEAIRFSRRPEVAKYYASDNFPAVEKLKELVPRSKSARSRTPAAGRGSMAADVGGSWSRSHHEEIAQPTTAQDQNDHHFGWSDEQEAGNDGQ